MPKHKCAAWRPGCGPFKYAQVKLDGIWLEASWHDGHLLLQTSLPTNVTAQLGYLDWTQRLGGFHESYNTKLYGELVSPGKPASDVKSAIKEQRLLDYVVFAIYEPTDICTAAPLEYVQDYVGDVYGLHFAPYILYDDIVGHPRWVHEQLGGEGVVFKNGNLLDWTKWKPVQTVDCVVTGVTEGEGKYLGLIGALRCGVYGADGMLREIARVSGMDDATRAAFSLEEPLGQVVEVAYQYVGSQGRLRHPRFVRLRDDKDRRTCTDDQM